MEPLAIVAQAEQPPGLDGAVVEQVEREGALRCALEQARMQDLDARVDEGRHFPFPPAADSAELIDEEIAPAVIADCRGGGLQEQEPIHPFYVPELGETEQRIHLAIEPDDLAVDD